MQVQPEKTPTDLSKSTFKHPELSLPWKGRVLQALGKQLLEVLKIPQKANELVKTLLMSNTLVRTPLMLASTIKADYSRGFENYKLDYGGVGVELKTKENISIQGMYFSAKDSQKNPFVRACEYVGSKNESPREDGPTVILCIGSDRSLFDPDNKSIYPDIIQSYLARGLNVMCFDYQGVGLSKGTFTEKGSYESVDVAMEFVKSKGVPKDKILVEGYSMGSGPATHLASKNAGISLLLRNPFAKTSLAAKGFLEQEKIHWFWHKMAALVVDYLLEYNNIKKIDQVHGRIGLISAPGDMFAEKSQHVEKLADAATKPGAKPTSFYHRLTAKDHFSTYAAEGEMAQSLDEYLVSIGFTKQIQRNNLVCD